MLHDRILSIRSGPRKYTLKDDILTNGYIFVWKVVQTSLFMVCSGSQLIKLLSVVGQNQVSTEAKYWGHQMDAELHLYGNYNDHKDCGVGFFSMTTLGSFKKEKNNS